MKGLATIVNWLPGVLPTFDLDLHKPLFAKPLTFPLRRFCGRQCRWLGCKYRCQCWRLGGRGQCGRRSSSSSCRGR